MNAHATLTGWRAMACVVPVGLVLLGVLLGGAAVAQSSSLLDGVGSVQEVYACPMHPDYRTEAPGSCPICGMDLVQVGGEARAGGTVSVPPAMIQSMGVRIRAVDVADFGRVVRAFGSVEVSTRLQTVVASRVEGWVEALAVTAEGDPIARGALLYRVFSPELIAAQQDYLAALRANNAGRLQSAARRLRSLGMQDQVVAVLTRERKLIEQVPVYAESAGVVALLATREGAYVKLGDLMLRLQSYEEVWVIAAVAEQDLPDLRVGMPALLDSPTLPGGAERGVVDYIYPQIDPRTRTGRVRVVVANEGGRLKPGAYADVQFEADGRQRLAVPVEAVLRDSRGSHVIVALGEGRFAGRAISPGITAGGRTEVLDGLERGERVVVSGQFMLDSEASLREAFTKLGGQHAGHQHGAMGEAPQPASSPLPEGPAGHQHEMPGDGHEHHEMMPKKVDDPAAEEGTMDHAGHGEHDTPSPGAPR